MDDLFNVHYCLAEIKDCLFILLSNVLCINQNVKRYPFDIIFLTVWKKKFSNMNCHVLLSAIINNNNINSRDIYPGSSTYPNVVSGRFCIRSKWNLELLVFQEHNCTLSTLSWANSCQLPLFIVQCTYCNKPRSFHIPLSNAWDISSALWEWSKMQELQLPHSNKKIVKWMTRTRKVNLTISSQMTKGSIWSAKVGTIHILVMVLELGNERARTGGKIYSVHAPPFNARSSLTVKIRVLVKVYRITVLNY